MAFLMLLATTIPTSPASTAALDAFRASRISSSRPGSRSRCQPPTLPKSSLPKLAFSFYQLGCLGHRRIAGILPALEWIYRQSYSRLRSEEHTSELQSPNHLVSRLLLQKKNKS